MNVIQQVHTDGPNKTYGATVLTAGCAELRIIEKGLALFLDYNPRRIKDKPSYEDKKTAVEMIEAIKRRFEQEEEA